MRNWERGVSGSHVSQKAVYSHCFVLEGLIPLHKCCYPVNGQSRSNYWELKQPYQCLFAYCFINLCHLSIKKVHFALCLTTPTLESIPCLPKRPDGVLIGLRGAAAVGNVRVGPESPPVLIAPPPVQQPRVEQQVERGGHVYGKSSHHCRGDCAG